MEYRSTRIVGWVESVIPIVLNLDLLAVKRTKDTNDSDICGWTKSRRVRLRTVLLPSIEIRWTWCASAPYKLSSFFMSRKYMPAVCRQFDAGVLPDDQIQVTCELRQQRHAVDLDFRERGIAEIMPARHFADVAGNPIAG